MFKNRKIVAFFLALITVFTLSGCSQNKIPDVSRIPIYTSTIENSDKSNQTSESAKNNSSVSKNNTTSKNSNTTTSVISDSSNKPTETSKAQHIIDKEILPNRPIIPGEPQFDPNIPLLKFSDLTKICDFDAGLRDWAYNEDTIYLLTELPNQIYIFNVKDPYNPKTINLPNSPNKIRFYNNKLYVSSDKDQGILIFNPKTLKQEGKIEIGKRVYSFDINGDDIYYTADVFANRIYHYSISKKESSVFDDDIISLYSLHKADLLYSKENNYLYVSDCNSTGGNTLLHYNTKTKEFIEAYSGPDNERVILGCAKMHIFNDEIYWAKYSFSKHNIDSYKVHYEGAYKEFVDIFSVDNRGVVTTNGIYTKNGTKKLQFDFSTSKIIYTKSNYLIVMNDASIYIKPNVKP